jgi:RNA polymerase sigma factor (sigma-70 family)
VHPLTPAQRDLATKWYPLACKFALRHVRQHRHLEPYLDDLKQAGAYGLVVAAARYDPSRGAFSTYAWPWIRNYVWDAGQRYLNITSGCVEGGRLRFDVRDYEADVYSDWAYAGHGENEDVEGRLAANQAWAKAKGFTNPRDAEAYIRSTFGGESTRAIGKSLGLSHEWVNQLVRRAQPIFEEWAASVRKEAA